MGTKFLNSRQVAVNHQWVGRKLTRKIKFAVIDGVIYRIIDNGPDETANPNGLDILSLQLAEDIDLPNEVNKNG